ARLLPRLACALNMRLFVHFVQTVQASPVLALHSKNDASKIVQICALFCTTSNTLKACYYCAICRYIYATVRMLEMNMKTVTDAEFRANIGDMLEYLRSGGSITIKGEDRKDVVLSGSDLSPEYLAASDDLRSIREKVTKMSQHPLLQTTRELEKRHPALFSHGKKALSFEEAMKRTKEKHAEIIKRLEDN
ncbi:hypothetical protein, partial [Klebsiella michiganensis]|uniref:hypothetical protein n=1 Tax=Klebsiella michiganensis TaxID=1134687 RepID=UPI0029310A24